MKGREEIEDALQRIVPRAVPFPVCPGRWIVCCPDFALASSANLGKQARSAGAAADSCVALWEVQGWHRECRRFNAAQLPMIFLALPFWRRDTAGLLLGLFQAHVKICMSKASDALRSLLS